MKIFIAGARSVQSLPPKAKNKLMQIYSKGYDVLVGDCYGVDASVQKFYSDLKYSNVTVYANNGYARNNVGGWTIHVVSAPQSTHGFNYYKIKDNAMAKEADHGFMIWDGKSKGTLNNIVTLISQNKDVLVYLANQDVTVYLQSVEELNNLISKCPQSTQELYAQIRAET